MYQCIQANDIQLDKSLEGQVLKQEDTAAGIQHVRGDMQRLVLEIQKATKSPRPMNPAALFLYLRSFAPQHHKHSQNSTLPQPNRKTESFPGSSLFGSHILIDKNNMSASTVLRMLLFSVANGFAGLDDIPAKSIIAHLRLQANATSLLHDILKLPGHIPRALADNLLKAAVDAKDVDVAKLLIELRPSSASINEIRTRGAGKATEQMSLLESAAANRDTAMVSLLLSHGADPNKRFPLTADPRSDMDGPPHSTRKNPISMLVGDDPSWMRGIAMRLQRRKEDGVAPAKLLLDAGCKFLSFSVDHALKRSEVDLAILLAMHVPPKQHKTMMSMQGMLVRLVRYAGKEADALAVVERWHYICNGAGVESADAVDDNDNDNDTSSDMNRNISESDPSAVPTVRKRVFCGQCPPRYGESTITWMLIEASMRRFLNIIDFFTTGTNKNIYAPHIKWPMVLTAALRTKTAAVIDRVLAMELDVAGCEKHTVDRHDHDYGSNPSAHRYSTPLSEAIETKQPEYITLFESLGALDALKTNEDHRRCALQAASTVGNTAYLRKIMEHCKDQLRPQDMSEAMAMAILSGHEEAFYTLFHAGGDLCHKTNSSPSTPDAMFAAVYTRNLPISLLILAAGAGMGSGSRLTSSYYHSYDTYKRRTADSQQPEDSGCVYTNPQSEPQQSSCVLEQAVLWGQRDIIVGIKTLRPVQCLTYPSHKARICLQENHAMLDFLVSEQLINADGLQRCVEHALSTQDEAFLDKLLALGCDCLNDRVLGAAIEAPKLLRKILHNAKRSRDSSGMGPKGVGFGSDALVKAIKLWDTATQLVFSTRPVVENGRQIGREAVFALLESGLVDVRFAQYSSLPLVGAVKMYKYRPKGPETEQGDRTLGEGASRSSHDIDDEFDIIRALLAHGAHPDDVCHTYRDQAGATTAFLEAIDTKDVALVRLMLEHGATVNYPAPPTLLSSTTSTAEKHNDPVVTDTKAQRRTLFFSGLTRTPLQMAVEKNSAAVVDMLLNPQNYHKSPSSSSGSSWEAADVNAPAAHRSGATVLQIAAAQGNCGIAATLLAHGADINAPIAKVWGKSALVGAAENGRLEMVDFLLGNGYVFEKGDCEKAVEAAEANGEAGCAARIREIMAEVTDTAGGGKGSEEEGVEEVVRDWRL